ncbi:Golgi SNAP receptor complex member 1 isoform X3 [Hippopotamus amphibius kiboko]|uniref:Golgi SNAP receptor complex member 1 isoform X3 n=1 Tax=Hippopotamus amphibius kiboko TaxID=575201 RepID=UPI002591DCDB|nr:Golgi SNAP receptor complex member 1 isoform X3 [Hippopotamus amphibius kiboko]
MAAGTSNYWEDLRKQARQLENELDLKLVSFSKLCTSYSHSSARDGRRDRYSSDTTPLLNGSSQDRMFETMAIEIEQLLARLTGVNDKMAEYTNSAGVPSLNAALMHTLQRHRDILQDYTHEFHKTKANFVAIRERENLMGSVRKDIESYKSGSGVNNRRTELFLKEHDHLRKSSNRRDNKKSSSSTKNFHIPLLRLPKCYHFATFAFTQFFFLNCLKSCRHDVYLPLNISVFIS